MDQYYSKVQELNLVGLSQGGLMARSILEDCTINSNLKYRNLLTIGTPNMGVSEIPELGCNKKSIDPSMKIICQLQHGVMTTLPYSDLA